ncbi:MAG: mannose-1-phosphate guanylyltransferase, partial [Muribaculaceae bacterium]|nr:mannose-1-phosphate guanylyltransferase [Muribaculaceae bacterium]
CVIMCGGVGSRFWPASRQNKPKQFLDFMGTGRTLLQMTFDRILPLVDAERVIIVTNADYKELIQQQLPDVHPENILLEPARRNTAPCIAWAASHIAAMDPDASMVVMPSDHLITRERVFLDALRSAFEFAEANDALLTLGIKPSRPETGYGYIQRGPAVADGIDRVKTFTEKPNEELAKVFLASGEFLWNAGVFIWTARNLLNGLTRHCPDVAQRFQAPDGVFASPAERRWIARQFPACPSVSIDYALMEKATNVYVKEVDPGWSDLGTWSALHEVAPKNRAGNVTHGCSVVSYDTTGSIFTESTEGKIIVVDGLKDYVVADTDNVLLICPLAHEQQIKQYVNDVNMTLGDKYL